MKLTLLEEKKQPLLSRRDLVYTLAYPKASTPSQAGVIKLLLAHLHVKEDVLALESIQPTFGGTEARVTAVVYDSPAFLQQFGVVAKKKKTQQTEGQGAKPAEEKKG